MHKYNWFLRMDFVFCGPGTVTPVLAFLVDFPTDSVNKTFFLSFQCVCSCVLPLPPGLARTPCWTAVVKSKSLSHWLVSGSVCLSLLTSDLSRLSCRFHPSPLYLVPHITCPLLCYLAHSLFWRHGFFKVWRQAAHLCPDETVRPRAV